MASFRFGIPGVIRRFLSAQDYGKINPRKPLRKQVRQRTFRIDLNMREWRIAVELAEDVLNPRREQLYRLYHRTMEDGHVLAQVRTARFNVQLAPFEIHRDGVLDDEAKTIFDDPWFFRYLGYAVDTELYGHSLIEFSEPDESGMYQSVHLIPREHVRPETGEILITTSDVKGLPFREPPLSNSAMLVELGDDDDLGLLKAISKAVIRKEYSISDWSRRNERFGMPFITVKTASRDEKELDEKEKMLQTFGANGYAILDDMDEVDMHESAANSGNAHLSYKTLIDDMANEITILINGQTGTTDEKAFVGSAEVHERVMNKYTLARLRRIQNDINHQLIPFLRDRLGYPLQDCLLYFKELMQTEDGILGLFPKDQGDDPVIVDDPEAQKKN